MIQTLDAIRNLDFRRVPIAAFDRGRVLVEVASDRPVDLAVVTSQEFKNFQTPDTELSFEFAQGVRTHDFVVDVSPSIPMSLLIWNSNGVGDAFIAYKVSELTEADRLGRPMRTLAGVAD